MLIELVCNAGAMKKGILRVKFATRLVNFFFFEFIQLINCFVFCSDCCVGPTLVQHVSL
jgi:hypothetical protein